MKESTKYKMTHKSDFGKEKVEILFEDQYLMVILKPSGLLSESYPGSKSKTVLDVVESLMRKAGTYSTHHKPFIVHRLDRDTSGVMMLAMTETAQKKIMDMWHKMVSERLYRAVAENPLKKNADFLPNFGLIDAPLAYNSHNIGFVPKKNDKPNENASKVKKYAEKSEKGREKSSIYERNLEVKNNEVSFKTVPARTHFRVVERGISYTLFELSLDTGKKNQIRAHLASKGYPLAGDENYRAKSDPLGRLALHARTLEFDHPFTGEHLKFEKPEPESWLDCVKNKKLEENLAIWTKSKKFENHSKNQKKSKSEDFTKMPKDFISRKKLSGMDFIQQGKMKKH